MHWENQPVIRPGIKAFDIDPIHQSEFLHYSGLREQPITSITLRDLKIETNPRIVLVRILMGFSR